MKPITKTIKEVIRNNINKNVLLYFLFSVQSILGISRNTKIIYNILLLVLSFLISREKPVFNKNYFIIASLILIYYLINEPTYENTFRLFNNLYFVTLIFILFIKDDDVVPNFIKSLKLLFLLTLPLYLLNYKDIIAYRYSLGFGMFNRNAVAVIFTGYFLYLMTNKQEKYKILKFIFILALTCSTRSRGGILIIIGTVMISFLLKLNIFKNRLVPFILVASYLIVFYLTYNEFMSRMYLSGTREFIDSKLIVLDPLYIDFQSASVTQLFFGIDYFKPGVAGTDFEYTLLIIEVLYKYGIVGLIIFFIHLYYKTYGLIKQNAYADFMVISWSSMVFIFGAGLLAPSVCMLGFWLIYFSAHRRLNKEAGKRVSVRRGYNFPVTR